ncbi:hypothetical protein QAD02_005234 [Eretmocerus hayati]|uniref:Uncharacterized protein n=1 Tax=Eretmocerus hayati TaxID=131215 RepID=A0ACC2NS81_9HYME|nr:hypothetical protein QAD02_005234 [Eretmocerus hayati]
MFTPGASRRGGPSPLYMRSQLKISYSAAAKQDVFPKREQGVVMDCAGELTLTDYTVAVGDIVQPKNISHSPRISRNRHIAKHCEKQQTLIDANTDQAQQSGSEEPQVEINGKEGSAVRFENPQRVYDQTVILTDREQGGRGS